MMPTKKRGSIGEIKPTGWVQKNVFVYNIQPRILLDYKTGESKRPAP